MNIPTRKIKKSQQRCLIRLNWFIDYYLEKNEYFNLLINVNDINVNIYYKFGKLNVNILGITIIPTGNILSSFHALVLQSIVHRYLWDLYFDKYLKYNKEINDSLDKIIQFMDINNIITKFNGKSDIFYVKTKNGLINIVNIIESIKLKKKIRFH